MSNLRVVRLTNGEHVVCQLTPGDEHTYIVKHGYSIVPDQDNPQQVRYIPFAPFSATEGVVELTKSSVSFVSLPAAAVAEAHSNILSGTLTPVTDE